MFGKKKNSMTPLDMAPERFDTLIGEHAEIHGSLKIRDSVRIDGKVVGTIEAPRDADISVVIGPTGEVQGDVLAGRVVVAGRVAGKVHGFDRVEIMASAWVQGDVQYASLAVEHGAKLLGQMVSTTANDLSAPLEIGTTAGAALPTSSA